MKDDQQLDELKGAAFLIGVCLLGCLLLLVAAAVVVFRVVFAI